MPTPGKSTEQYGYAFALNPYNGYISTYFKEFMLSAVDFLFLPGIQKVLAQTYSHLDRDFTLNELLANAPGGRGTNQRHIDGLIRAGVLTEGPRRARQRSIRANPHYFLFDELRNIAMKTFALREPLQAALQPFKEQIQEAFVFGSIAKQTDTAQSDIDLIVVGNLSLLAISEVISQAEQALKRTINTNLYAPDEWLNLKANDPVLMQIANGPKLRILPDDIAN
jgi:uncharacterized protein